MPIRRELRDLYPAHWSALSRRVRFERVRGVCQGCGGPHGSTVRRLSDGRWFDPAENTWRDAPHAGLNLEHMVRRRTTRVVLAAAHLDHNATTSGH